MTVITCPDCGQVTSLDAVRHSADEFCTHCDFPLFWARPEGFASEAIDDTDVSRRRLPGTGGRLTVGHRPCPSCGEQNHISAVRCIRCKALMDPAPPPPMYVPPPPFYNPPVEPKSRWKWWYWVIIGAVVVAALVVVVIATR